MAVRPPDWQPGPDTRIGIIGAGPSGLTAAHALAEAGYERVMLFEQAADVGGKCESVEVDGRVYELGAVLGSPSYHLTREFGRRTHTRTAACGPCRYYEPDGRRAALFAPRRLPALAYQLFIKYAWLARTRYRDIYRPGLAGLHPDLHASFAEFAARHGLSRLPPLFQPVATGFGYGYAEDVPAAYMMKYLDWPTIRACARGKGLFIWPEGIQTLWRRLSYEHDVLRGVRIGRIHRGLQVTVSCNKGVFTFDALILACPLQDVAAFLDVTPDEQALFQRIRTYDYWVLLAEVAGLPPGTGFLPAHFAAAQQGHLMLWYGRWPDVPLYTLYALGDARAGANDIEATCAADLRRLSATLRRVRAVRHWRYFPHVSGADMAGGFYERLEGLQGQRHTFYCGELLSFSTIECVARYARDLVDRFFPPAKAAGGRPAVALASAAPVAAQNSREIQPDGPHHQS